ncbi:MAG: hypothetical protein ACLFU6_01960 [Candidatus Hydrogenedentota bacterium]
MFRCLKARGLLAASVYDDLAEQEARWLQGHVERCARCRRRQAELAALKEYVPVSRPVLGEDLLPVLKSRLSEMQRRSAPNEKRVGAPSPGREWRLAVSAALCALAVGVFAWQTAGPVGLGSAAPESQETYASSVNEEEAVWTQMEQRLQARDYTGAYQVVEEALENENMQPWAAEARLILADLAYGHLQWYDAAFESYSEVVQNHRHVLEADERLAEVVTRWNMLAEARKNDYASLHALHAATGSASGDFDALENVVARYPGTFVASEAVRAMAHLAIESDAGAFQDNGDRLAALGAAREQARHPIVKAQVDYEIGQHHLTQNGDKEKARELLVTVSQSDEEALAERARTSLAMLQYDAGAR